MYSTSCVCWSIVVCIVKLHHICQQQSLSKVHWLTVCSSLTRNCTFAIPAPRAWNNLPTNTNLFHQPIALPKILTFLFNCIPICCCLLFFVCLLFLFRTLVVSLFYLLCLKIAIIDMFDWLIRIMRVVHLPVSMFRYWLAVMKLTLKEVYFKCRLLLSSYG